MIAAEKVAVLLLAAGLSSRFGAKDKLAEPLNGIPLGLHAARTLSGLPFAARIAVTRSAEPDFGLHGFTPVINPRPSAGQSGSIKIGMEQVRLAGPEAVLIALADMPLVTAAHIEALLAQFDDRRPIVASADGNMPGPPALFGVSLFCALESLEGDHGARHLLRDAGLVPTLASTLMDVDTPGDLTLAAVLSPAQRLQPSPGRQYTVHRLP